MPQQEPERVGHEKKVSFVLAYVKRVCHDNQRIIKKHCSCGYL